MNRSIYTISVIAALTIGSLPTIHALGWQLALAVAIPAATLAAVLAIRNSR